MAMSANWAEKACILAILLALFCAGCGKYDALERNMCLSLFWHFLDVVWICVFSVVYLMGAM